MKRRTRYGICATKSDLREKPAETEKKENQTSEKELAKEKAKAKGKTEDLAGRQSVTNKSDKARKGPTRDDQNNFEKVCGQTQNRTGDARSNMTDVTEKGDAKERRTRRKTNT